MASASDLSTTQTHHQQQCICVSHVFPLPGDGRQHLLVNSMGAQKATTSFFKSINKKRQRCPRSTVQDSIAARAMSMPNAEKDSSNYLPRYMAVHHQLGRDLVAGSLCRSFWPNHEVFAPKLAAAFVSGIDALRRDMLRTFVFWTPFFCGVGDNAACIVELLLPALRPCCVDEHMQRTSARVARVRHLGRLAAQEFLATPKLAMRPKLAASILTAVFYHKNVVRDVHMATT